MKNSRNFDIPMHLNSYSYFNHKKKDGLYKVSDDTNNTVSEYDNAVFMVKRRHEKWKASLTFQGINELHILHLNFLQ